MYQVYVLVLVLFTSRRYYLYVLVVYNSFMYKLYVFVYTSCVYKLCSTCMYYLYVLDMY